MSTTSLRSDAEADAATAAAAAAAPAIPYPFSSHARAHVPEGPPTSSARPAIPPAPQVNKSDRGIIPYVQHQLRSQLDPASRLSSLFARNFPTAIPVGSVIIVESWTSAAKTSTTSFAGVLMAIRRRGTSTSFVVRNLIQKLGVEVRFSLYSPMLKDVRVIARAEGRKGVPGSGLRRVKRAKLYCESLLLLLLLPVT